MIRCCNYITSKQKKLTTTIIPMGLRDEHLSIVWTYAPEGNRSLVVEVFPKIMGASLPDLCTAEAVCPMSLANCVFLFLRKCHTIICIFGDFLYFYQLAWILSGTGISNKQGFNTTMTPDSDSW